MFSFMQFVKTGPEHQGKVYTRLLFICVCSGGFVILFYFLIISLLTSLVADVVFEQVKSKELVYVDKARETPLYALGGLIYL